MAIFYEHIKGCNPINSFISWIEWSKETKDNQALTSLNAKYLPKIYVGDKNTSFGRIITSDAIEQVVNKDFTFKTNLTISNKTTSKEIEAETITTSKIQMSDRFNIIEDIIGFNGASIQSQDGVGLKFYSDGNFQFNKEVNVTGNIISSGKCQAQYFNATSDARAKSNITPAQFSALDVIKQLPIYTFNYRNDPKLSVGLIAQEAAEYDLDGFNMVDNLDAEGVFGDFMQIKESKLVYVLWKAVQELTDEVNSLKAQIQQLENK